MYTETLTFANTKYLHTLNGLEACLLLPAWQEQGQVNLLVLTIHLLTKILVSTVSGGNIASSWAVLQCMGQDGYMEVAKKLMEIATRMKEGIQSIEVNQNSFNNLARFYV